MGGLVGVSVVWQTVTSWHVVRAVAGCGTVRGMLEAVWVVRFGCCGGSHLGGGVDDVVDGLHREVEGHELHDWPQLLVRRAGGQPCEARLRDRRVDHALLAKLLEQALRDLQREGVW